jgi:hypothetical protein
MPRSLESAVALLGRCTILRCYFVATFLNGPPASQDRASQNRFGLPDGRSPATINKESSNENNTDVDRWADARRLRINGKSRS